MLWSLEMYPNLQVIKLPLSHFLVMWIIVNKVNLSIYFWSSLIQLFIPFVLFGNLLFMHLIGWTETISVFRFPGSMMDTFVFKVVANCATCTKWIMPGLELFLSQFLCVNCTSVKFPISFHFKAKILCPGLIFLLAYWLVSNDVASSVML